MPTRRKDIENGDEGGNADFKIQLASDGSGEYVDVVALDAGGGGGGGTETSISGAAAITPSNTVPVTEGRQFLVNCTVTGNVKVAFSDSSTLIIPVAVGLSILPWAVIQVFVTGTTATATYANLL